LIATTLGFVEDATLIVFWPKEIIPAQFLGDKARALLLAVHRIRRDQGAGREGELFEQRLERGPIWRTLFKQLVFFPLAFARANAGRRRLARIAIIAITTNNSISVNAAALRASL
jgi:hypothetical protein